MLKDYGSFMCLRGFPSPLLRTLFCAHLRSVSFEHDCMSDFGKMLVRRHRCVSQQWATLMSVDVRLLGVDMNAYNECAFFFGIL